MELHGLRSRSLARLLVVALAIAMVATVGLAAIPAARGNFTGNGITLAPGKYTGTNTYVPGETIQITLTATPGDSIDLLIQNASGTPSASITGLVIPTSGQRIVQWTVPSTWPDGFTYSVQARDTTSGQVRTRGFNIETYSLSVWTDRSAYLPGDSVTISWSATLIQDDSPAPDGVGAIQVLDAGGNNLLPIPQWNFTGSQGNYSFTLSASLAPGTRGWVYTWFNSTDGLRQTASVDTFLVNNLGVLVIVQRATYAPSDVVSVSIYTRVTPNPANTRTTDPIAPNIPVSVNVTDLSTATVVAGYSAGGLMSDATGYLNYVFQLTSTPTTGSYEVDATATAHGVLSATNSDTFDVQATASLSVQLLLNKLQYLSGDTIQATAQVFSTGAPTLTYTWTVTDSSTGNILANLAGGAATYAFPIPTSYQGNLIVSVLVNDGNGTTAYAQATARVAFGYLALTLDKSQFSPGDTITATFSLQSNVITNPTYYWEVTDNGGATAAAGSTTGGTAAFQTPSPASTRYTFTVTASQNGRTVTAAQTATQIGGYFLSISLDRSSYNAGDTMTITYSLVPRGNAVLPAAYHFYITLYGVAYKYVDTTSNTGTLQMTVPGNTPTGDLILQVSEGNTGAYIYDIVHIGPVNPLVADVAGVPLFDILIFLLFLVLLLAVILLWRRTGLGKAPPSVETGKPSTPPPPPPSQGGQAAGPMTVACKHCGASIEITTSKRPIEVMCPSCGETQVVQ